MSILQRVELNFWHLVIPLIRESRVIRFFLRRLYGIFRYKFLRGFVIPTTISAGLGLLFGYVGGVFSTLW